MFTIWKMFFGRLFCSIDEASAGGDGSEGATAGEGEGGNGGEGGSEGEGEGTGTEGVKIGEVEVSQEEFDRIAKERYKDQFSSHEDREKWQAKLTQESQSNADNKRKADAYDRLNATQQPGNQQSATEQFKARQVDKLTKKFPDVSPEFIEEMVNTQVEAAGLASQDAMSPVVTRQGEDFERQFLKDHPDVKKNSPEYYRIGNLIYSGVDADDAYAVVFKDQIVKDSVGKAVKARDEDATRKLKQSRTFGQPGTKPKSQNFSDRANEIIDHMYTEK